MWTTEFIILSCLSIVSAIIVTLYLLSKMGVFDKKGKKQELPCEILGNKNCINCGAPLLTKGAIIKCNYCGKEYAKSEPSLINCTDYLYN